MSNTLDCAKLSDIIQSATQEMVNCTEAFIQSLGDEPLGADTITIMLNSKKIVLSKENYNSLKLQQEEIKGRMKALVEQMKTKLKNKP